MTVKKTEQKIQARLRRIRSKHTGNMKRCPKRTCRALNVKLATHCWRCGQDL